MGVACIQKCCFVSFLLLLVANAGAQPRCKVEYYSTEQGLSHQAVTAMVKDREGFMWFGSWDGINRFDGHSFVSYKSSPGDRSPLGSDRIDQIVEDQLDHLWLLAYDKHIYRFDKRTVQFLPLSRVIRQPDNQKITFTSILDTANGQVWLQSATNGIYCIPGDGAPDSPFAVYRKEAPGDRHLPSNNINFFHQDADHRIWIGTPEGLCRLERSSTGFYKNLSLPADICPGIGIRVFEEDGRHLYFGTADGHLITFSKSTRAFSVRKISEGHINALVRSRGRQVIYASTSAGELIELNIDNGTMKTTRSGAIGKLYTIYEDHAGVLWIEPERTGVLRLDPVRGSLRLFSQKVPEPYSYVGNRFKVFEDNSGTVWVNMKGGGFGYYNAAKDSMGYYLSLSDFATYHLPQIVFMLYYDDAGILWLRVNAREIIKIIFQGNEFTQQLMSPSEGSVLDNEVRGIFCDSKNRLWMGAKNGELYVYQNGQRVKGLFENAPPGGLGPVYSFLEDSRGNIWIGTKGDGLYKASPVNGEKNRYHLKHFGSSPGGAASLTSDEIYTMLEDHQHRIWIGTFDEGLFLAKEENDSIRFVHSREAIQGYLKKTFQKIRHMALDGAGNLWIGATDGLLLLDPDEHHSPAYACVRYGKIAGEAQSLGNNNIQFILRDSKNRMWLATSGGGLTLASGNQPFHSLIFRNYTTREGLPNDYVLSCAEDGEGNLWLATENGLSRFNPQTRAFRNYDSYDGLSKVGFSEASVCRQSSGDRLVFGTTRGFLSFDPRGIDNNRINANIVFTNLQINNEDAGPGANETVLKTNINYVPGLTLEYNRNIISIDYAVLDLRAGNRQAFAYRLVGFDTIWHNDRQLRRATYTNLPPGHYTFEVKSLSPDLYPNQPHRSLAITILPPPWKTWWAYCLYVILMGVIFFFVRRYALAMIRLRNKIAVEQKLAALKMNFFTNVSHELRTPLTLIVNPLEQLSKNEKLSSEGNSYVDVARKNAHRMVRFINQLLDLRKVQSEKATLCISRVEIVSFVQKIVDHFAEAARAKHIELAIVAAQKELSAWVDAEKFDVVIYNLIGNALKFTPEGKAIQIVIRSIPGEQSFSVSVCDHGPGVPKEKLKEIFELFYEGERQPGRALKGTGIGLALSKELVNLHKGSIWADNNEEGGLTVTVKLRLGPDHYKPEEVSFADSSQARLSFEGPAEYLPVQPSSFSPPTPKDPQAPLVLLVEDHDELRAFIREQLSEFYRVETARDGREGLSKAIRQAPDLIVSDIMMPEMDGIQMLDEIKKNVNTSHIPVVLLSAKYSIESQLEGLKYGADCYITKPFNNEFLMASIGNLIRQRKKLFEFLVEKKNTVALSPAPVVITSKDESFLKEVIGVVEDRMADVDFNIDAVAGAMAMSRTTFYKKFRSLTHLTPVEFVRDMRLQRAKQLLDAGENNVSEIAYAVGFNNPKYFSTCFREKYQVSPSDYLRAK